jgi:hypothetical protein
MPFRSDAMFDMFQEINVPEAATRLHMQMKFVAVARWTLHFLTMKE